MLRFILGIQSVPTLPTLLAFPGKTEKINIPERIGAKYKTFGTLLLQDDFGEKVDAIAEEKKSDVTSINLAILEKWLRGEGQLPKTWSRLCKVLRDSRLTALAKDIETVMSISV